MYIKVRLFFRVYYKKRCRDYYEHASIVVICNSDRLQCFRRHRNNFESLYIADEATYILYILELCITSKNKKGKYLFRLMSDKIEQSFSSKYSRRYSLKIQSNITFIYKLYYVQLIWNMFFF